MAEANRSSVDDTEENNTETINLERIISPSTTIQRGKRDRLGQLDENEISSSVNGENCKKAKRELPSDSISSPNSTLKNKRRLRNYRPRIMDSSSEDESNSSNKATNANEKDNPESNGTTINQNSHPENCNSVSSVNVESEVAASNVTLSTLNSSDTSSAAANSERNDSADQSSSNVSSGSQEMEASNTSQMDTSQLSTTTNGSAAANSENTPADCRRMRRIFSNYPLDSDSDDSIDDDDDDDNDNDSDRRERDNLDRATRRLKLEETVTKEYNIIMGKSKPKHKWNSLQAVINRQYGMPGNRQAPTLFTNRYYDSLHVAQRLKLVSKLEFHTGCTNALNFNDSGDLLASSSDDLQIAIWDWSKEKTLITYNSGHRNNVFQCKFLPLSGNTHIASCARDGQVRLAELSSTGMCKDTRRLAKHSRSAHKLTVRVNTPYELMSAGEDAFVYNIDIRANQPDKIVLVKDIKGDRVPLYSIHQHPLNDNQFCVSGQDEYVRVYDRRIISTLGPPVLKYCPSHLVDKKPKSNITCAVYSNNGDGILASYNDEDIYFFDLSLSEAAAPAHRYSGHRNSSTVKGVNFFSPSSQFVVSGSDCGNVFIWDRDTEAIVNCMPADKKGVVNVLEPHPHLPVLATSGLDNEIKVWVPCQEEEPTLTNLQKTVRSNILRRLRDSNDDTRGLDTHMLMVLFQHLRRSSYLRARPGSGSAQGAMEEEDVLGMVDSSESSSDSTTDDEADDSDESSPSNRGDVVQCSTH